MPAPGRGLSYGAFVSDLSVSWHVKLAAMSRQLRSVGVSFSARWLAVCRQRLTVSAQYQPCSAPSADVSAVSLRMPRTRSTLVAMVLALGVLSAQALDLGTLWDFSRPDVSEARFRERLAVSSGDDALVLQTQIARTHGLRKDFDKARQVLREVEGGLATAGPEARIRWHLEWGRSFASAAHPPPGASADAAAQARQSFHQALSLARAAERDALAIDALHMMAFVDTQPVEQLHWAQQALSVVQTSQQPDAQRWEASIRHNMGYALAQLGRHEEALAAFEMALKLRERAGDARSVRVARWMVARTLRQLSRDEDALRLQLRLEAEHDAAAQPSAFVFDELEALYRARGDTVAAQRYAERRRALARP